MIFDKILKNGTDDEKKGFFEFIDVLLKNNNTTNYIYAMAEAHAIDLIASTVAKAEIQVFKKKDSKIIEVKDKEYWSLNIQPNYNESGSLFLYKLVTNLLVNKEALVLINENKKQDLYYVADEFDYDDKILNGKIFKNITIIDSKNNSIKLNKTYNSENSIYFNLYNNNLRKNTNTYSMESNKLLKTVSKKYIRDNTAKWRLTKPGGQPALVDFETGKTISYEEYANKVTEGLLSDEETVMLIAEVFGLANLNKDVKQSISDFLEISKKISDEVAEAYKIPLDIFHGTKTEKSTGNNDFISYAVDFIFDILEDGFNIGIVGMNDYLNGEYVAFNRISLFHRDIFDEANNIDKLTSDGFSRNEINKFLKLPKIDEDWADEHYVTKNYANVEGGE